MHHLSSSSLMLRRFCCLATPSFSSSAAVFSTSVATLTPSSSAKKKKLVFMGSPSVSASVLENLLDASAAADSLFEVAAIVTQPPSGRDRGRKVMPSPVAQHALDRGFSADLIFTPVKASEEAFLSDFSALEPELCITAAYGNILPTKFLKIPSLGTVNIHPSLLPLYRGAAPVQRALQDGVKESGVSLAFTVRALDAGHIIACEKMEINDHIKSFARKEMAPHFHLLPSLFKFTKTYFQTPKSYLRLPDVQHNSLFFVGSRTPTNGSPFPFVQASRSYARGRQPHYDLFGNGKPGDKKFREAWGKEIDEDDCLWTGSEAESDTENSKTNLDEEIKKVKQQAKDHSNLIDGDDSDELRSVWSGSDEEKTLWTGSEDDDDDDIPTDPYPNESSDAYIDKLFEFEEKPKYRTISELLKSEQEPEELSPGKQARKLAVENALKKLKKGPDGRFTNVWEVMSDLDILIGAFENIVSGPEYEELRKGGPKKLNMEFFKDIQARMRDPNYKFSPELKLKPKSKVVPRKKWQKAQSRRRKAQKR